MSGFTQPCVTGPIKPEVQRPNKAATRGTKETKTEKNNIELGLIEIPPLIRSWLQAVGSLVVPSRQTGAESSNLLPLSLHQGQDEVLLVQCI